MSKKQLYFFFIFLSGAMLWASCGDDNPSNLVAAASKNGGCVDKATFDKIAAGLRKDRRSRKEYQGDDAVWTFISTQGGKNCDGQTATPPSAGGSSTDTSKPVSATGKPIYSVFIENSASMDGYVQGNSEFKNATYNFLADILMKTNQITDSMNLNYINSKIIPFDEPLDDFIEKLNPSTFQKRGGERGTTDLYDVIKRSIDSVKTGRVVVFISDCVFSPGKNRNALDYLASQKTGIKRLFSDLVYAHKDLTTIVVKLNSSFYGDYYDYNNKVIKLAGQKRPYYIWIVGKYPEIEALQNKVKLEKINGGIEDFYAQYPRISSQPKHKIVKMGAVGRFEIDRDNINTITDAQVSDRGSNTGFGFNMMVDFSKSGVSESYLTDVTNYQLSSDKYKLVVTSINDNERTSDRGLEKFTHKLTFSPQDLKPMTVNVELKRKIPSWVEKSNSQDDRSQTTEELTKTFGIKYLIEGVADAYQSGNNSDSPILKTSITIKK
jgi:hypothetical protein